MLWCWLYASTAVVAFDSMMDVLAVAASSLAAVCVGRHDTVYSLSTPTDVYNQSFDFFQNVQTVLTITAYNISYTISSNSTQHALSSSLLAAVRPHYRGFPVYTKPALESTLGSILNIDWAGSSHSMNSCSCWSGRGEDTTNSQFTRF